MTLDEERAQLQSELDSYKAGARAGKGHHPAAMADITPRRIKEIEADIAALNARKAGMAHNA